VHQRFLRRQIDYPDVVSIRTDHGFLFGVPRGDLLVVDDMAVAVDSLWDIDGQRLLRAVDERGGVRFVCPVPEPARTRAAVALGMTHAESWWHRDLMPDPHAVPPDDPEVRVDGAAGRLVPAPPVYAPGGPVLLVLDVGGAESLAAIEAEASSAGAVVSVVTQRPTDTNLADLLIHVGYTRTTDFFEGRPQH